MRDVRYALRSLRKNPGLAVAVILTLALGIGANIAIFSVFEGVVLAPLPYHQPDRLALVLFYNRTLEFPSWLSYPDFLDWQRESRSFEQIAAFAHQGFDLTSPGEAEHVEGTEVSSNFFRTLGVKLALGRAITDAEDKVGGAPSAVISDRLWRDRFGGSASALGRQLTLNGAGYTVVGVLARGFRFFDERADVYTPIAIGDPMYRSDRTVHEIGCVGRLLPGVSIGQARAEMNTVQDHIDAANPSTERGLGVYVVPLKQGLVGDIGGTLTLLFGAVGLVLLIACSNVANVLLARSAARTREFAIRMALGASRAQIVRLLVTESVLLSLAGGALGLAVAKWGVRIALAASPGNVPRVENIAVNAWVLLFALAVSIVVGIVFGLLPALETTSIDAQIGLREGGRSVAGVHQRMQRVLVVAQIALAFVLLAGGSLLFRTMQNLLTVNPGFDAHHVVTFQVGLSRNVDTPAKMRAAYQGLVDRVRQVPSVQAAEIIALVPLGHGANEGPFWTGARQPASMAEIPRAIYYPAGPDYLRAMRIPLLRGRFLARTDTANSQLVVVIDSLLARRYFPNRNPIGETITFPHWGAASNVPFRIVGVVGHVEQYEIDGSGGEKPQLYYSFYQLPDDAIPVFRSEVALAVRTNGNTATAMPAIRSAIEAAGSDQPIYNVRTMEELVSRSMGRQRFPMLLLAAFALLALALAFVGTYGLISYSTARRVHEIGIRMALGAEASDVLRTVVGAGMRLGVAGIAAGFAAALVLGRVVPSLTRLLYGVSVVDPPTLAIAGLVLMAAATAACFVPARRAAGLDPMVALRDE